MPGLPCFCEDETGKFNADEQDYVTSTAWGIAKPMYGDRLGYELSAITPLYYTVRNDDNTVPDAQMPVLGYAVVDPITSIATVYAETNTEPVFNTSIPLLDGNDGNQILRQVRAALAQAGVAVYPEELRANPSLPYPWDDESGFSVTHVANSEITVPMVGYAVDSKTTEMVYLHMTGVKTGLRSIWGTINNGGQQAISVVGGGQHHYAFSSHNYTTFSDVVNPDTNLCRLMLVDRRAVDKEVDDRAYLLIPKSDDDEFDIYTVFAARLNALLPIPVLPEWGEVLYAHGISDEGELLVPCLHGGDVEKAFAIGKEGWIEAIELLITEGELSINIE